MNRSQGPRRPSPGCVYSNTHPRGDPYGSDNESGGTAFHFSPNDCACDAEKIRSEIQLLQSTSKEALKQSNEQLMKLRKDISQSISEISYLEAAIKKARRAEKEALERIASMEQISFKRKNNDMIKTKLLHKLNASLFHEETDDRDAEKNNKADSNHELRLASRDLVIQAMEESLLHNMKRIQKLQESTDSRNKSIDTDF